MGVKVVSVERRDTPTRYNLFRVRVGYGLDESDVPIGRMILVFFLQLKVQKGKLLQFFPPPPRRPLYFWASYCGSFERV